MATIYILIRASARVLYNAISHNCCDILPKTEAKSQPHRSDMYFSSTG